VRPSPSSTPNQAFALYYGASRRPLAWVAPDPTYPGVFRVRLPDGRLSGMLNLARAKDAAAAIAGRGPPTRDPRLLHWDHSDAPSAGRGCAQRPVTAVNRHAHALVQQ
jgi:hypothetical protein